MSDAKQFFAGRLDIRTKCSHRCKECARIEPFKRKGFLWWCVAWGRYINPNSYAPKLCFTKERE